MKIYRIEHRKTHKGPYNSIPLFPVGSIERNILISMYAEHVSFEGKQTHPGPITDKIEFSPFNDVFGFSSLEKLYDWFHGFTDYLFQMGFIITENLISDDFVFHGQSGKQVAFDPYKVVKISEVSI